MPQPDEPDDDAVRHVSALDDDEDLGDDGGDDADVDPGIKAAGAAVRSRRRELDITQRGLAASA